MMTIIEWTCPECQAGGHHHLKHDSRLEVTVMITGCKECNATIHIDHKYDVVVALRKKAS